MSQSIVIKPWIQCSLYECTRKSVDKSDVEDDRDVKEGHDAVGEDELVDESDGEVGSDPPQQDEVDSAEDS